MTGDCRVYMCDTVERQVDKGCLYEGETEQC